MSERILQIPLSDDAEEQLQERKILECFQSIAETTSTKATNRAMKFIAEKWDAYLTEALEADQ